MLGNEIVSVQAMQVFTWRSHPGIEVFVRTRNGSEGRAVCTAGISIGTHEVKFAYDGGTKWKGMGVEGAVRNVEEIIAPHIIGMDASKQYEVDSAMLNICENAKEQIGGNAIAATSAAVLKAGAKSLEIPLYYHIGGVNAMYLPVPGVPAAAGHKRYGGCVTTPDTKPTYSFMCFGFDSFSEASYAGWEVQELWKDTMRNLGIYPPDYYGLFEIPEGIFNTDEELWELMTKTINKAGYEGKIGIQVDVASDCYYDKNDKLYKGLFSRNPKTKEEMLELYIKAVKDYPFVIIEDPFFEDDYLSHAELVKNVDIMIVGDDLFTTNIERVAHGASLGAANAVLLKVNQVGTISDAMEMVQYAYRKGYGIMPCESRGEGEAIADYCVGINAFAVREMAVGVVANRFLAIEKELGSKARFSGAEGLYGKRLINIKK
jgi:enolase